MSRPRTARPITPQLLGGLLLAGSAIGLANPSEARAVRLAPPLAREEAAPFASGGMQTTGLVPGARLWLAQAEGGEGGEGGEAGAVAGAPADLAFLARLHIVEGHLRGAVALYHDGFADEALGVAYHPEAEMMDEVRADLAARGLADFSADLAAVGAAIESAGPVEAVDAAMAQLAAAIAQAAAPDAAEKRLRAEALVLLLRAAASDYATAVATPEAIDLVPFAEAHGFVMTARDRAAELAAEADPAVAVAGQKMLTALAEAEALFAGTPTAGDPAILLAVAARIELAASGVK